MARLQINRLEEGGCIDRSKPLNFSFNGKRLQGFAGDTLASALLANGVKLVSRSFKLHRPRGIVAAGAEEPNAILQIGRGAETLPNLRATQVELYEGLEARSTKGWPSLRFDIAAINDRFSGLFGAGFYYKTFMWPKSFWKHYEAFIRASAGLGNAPTEADPDHYEHRNAHCDVLVAGGGPAGLMAALVAGRSGARVIMVDDQDQFGGRLLSQRDRIDDMSGKDWVQKVTTELSTLDNVRLLPRSTVFGYYDHNFLAIAERCSDHLPQVERKGVRERLWRVRAKQVVLAQGAFERPLVFCNNDRPGVMTASAVSTYINRYGVCPGQRVVVFTNNDSAYTTALDIADANINVVVIDSRVGGAGSLGKAARARDIPVLQGHIVTDVVGCKRISRVRVAKWSGDTEAVVENSINIDCDLLAMSGGWSPAVHLHSQSGGKNLWNAQSLCFEPGESIQANFSAGASNGRWQLSDCLRDGLRAGLEALKRCNLTATSIDAPAVEQLDDYNIEALWRVPAAYDADHCSKQFIDYQNDTSVADIRQAVSEGYQNVEHVKRYTALGFGTDQGKLGNINGMAVLAECLGEDIPAIGTTTFRPAYTPVTFGVGAGKNVGLLFDPTRKSAIHDLHVSAGAAFEPVGQWLRPWYFPKANEDLHAAVARECIATRKSVGMMDASTLGKIDARGPDVVKFLERIYTHNIRKMRVGRCAYGIMLGEDGMLMDDGVMARLGENHFYLTTTTGGAANVLSWMESWLQTEWPELDVYLTSLTDHFSTIAVAGPNSRNVLQKRGCDAELAHDAFPFMSVRDTILGGFPVQLFRVSFSGELAFEINIDSAYAADMWQMLVTAGTEFDLTPYGTETMHVLRAEKGFVIVGQDTDGSVTPVDLRMNWLLSKDKDFLGKRSLERPDCIREGRKQLVGLLSEDNETVIPEGTQLLDDPSASKPVPMCGHVTSSYFSACLGHPIALALVSGGHKRKGEIIYASLADGSAIPVKIVSPVFYDAKGDRQSA